jgi:hypothetical protein
LHATLIGWLRDAGFDDPEQRGQLVVDLDWEIRRLLAAATTGWVGGKTGYPAGKLE